MTFDLGDIDNITQVKVFVNVNDIASGKCNQPSTTACRYRKYALSSLLKPPSHEQCQSGLDPDSVCMTISLF